MRLSKQANEEYRKKYYAENKEVISKKRKLQRIEKIKNGDTSVKNTCAKTVPDWLVTLPPGKYLLKEICDKTEQAYTNVYSRLMALGVHREPLKEGDKKHVYDWKGAKYYVRKFMNEKFGG